MRLVHRMLSDIIESKLETGSCDLEWFESYADGSDCEERGILAADWNAHYDYNPATKKSTTTPTWFSRLNDAIERSGFPVTLDWSDNLIGCCGCYKAIQTQTDYMGWRPKFWVTDGAIYCEDCIAADADLLDAYAESQVNDPCGSVETGYLDWESRGWIKFFDAFEDETDCPHEHTIEGSLQLYAESKGYDWLRYADREWCLLVRPKGFDPNAQDED